MKRSFQIHMMIRILFIALPAFGIGWSIFSQQSFIYAFIFFLSLLIAVTSLIQYQNKVNEKITYFFEAVKNEDFSQAFPEKKGDVIIRELNRNLNEVNKQIQQIKIESHQQEQYFQALIEHVGTGILTYDENGFVIHANSAVKKLFGLGQLTHLKQLGKLDKQLVHQVSNMPAQGQKLITFNGKQGNINLSIKSSLFKNNDKNLALLSVQDINQELDEKELDSWLRLIRVLTHEIMNSIAPITSLSESLSGYFQKDGKTVLPAELSEKTISITIRGLEIIREQGKDLISFVESYRKLTRLPKPEKNVIHLKEFLERILILNKPELDGLEVSISASSISPDLTILADEKMIAQVLINLIKNAKEALTQTKNGWIQLLAGIDKQGRTEICVKDNGPGIPEELLDEIFVPFFTTRESGSGIGLSLSRQIMRLHGGALAVRSVPQKETVFCMRF